MKSSLNMEQFPKRERLTAKMERKAEAISDARKAKKGTSFNRCVRACL